jgi:hypothetical protein
MKTFINKKTEITKAEQVGEKIKTTNLGFADLALVGLQAPPKDGWSVKDMRMIFKVIDKLEGLDFDQSVELTDEEFDQLVKSSNVQWTAMHKDIVAFDDYLEELKN